MITVGNLTFVELPANEAMPPLGSLWEQLEGTFGPEELRTAADYARAMRDPRMVCMLVLKGDEPVAYVSVWEFEHFIYIEHFMVDPSCRGTGIGSEILQTLLEQFHKPFVLEVEAPDPARPITERRIAFYARNGFVLWPQTWMQPPYRRGQKPVPMRLMATADLDADTHYKEVSDALLNGPYSYVEVLGRDNGAP